MSSPVNRPLEILHALREMFSVIDTSAPYTTGIGQTIDVGSVSADLSTGPRMSVLTTGGGWVQSPTTHNRTLDVVITASMRTSAHDAQCAALAMLQDIETAVARRDLCRMIGVYQIRLTQWQVLDPPEGGEGVLLLITAEADYCQPKLVL